MRHSRHRTFLPLLLLVLVPLFAGCGEKIPSQPDRENLRPTARLTRAPSRTGDLYSYSYEMRWTGYDPDGEVVRFIYAVDPPAPSAVNPEPDTAWTSTADFTETFRFDATVPQPPSSPPLAADYHVFVLKAVDDRGLASAPVIIAFNASTIAPIARILDPVPSSRYRLYLPPSFTVTWEGFDEDGTVTQQPAHYRIKLITASTPITPALMTQFPDTLIRYYRERNWATWDSLPGSATSHSFSTLAPLQDYAFVILAFDEAGAYTPYTSGDVNVMNFRALYANTGGPKLTVWNDFFSYSYVQGVYAPNDRRYEIFIEVPSGISLTFNWSGEASEGTFVRHYRWVLDIENLDDQTARTNERTDVHHWSQPTATIRSATVGPFTQAGDHRFYIEATDANNLRSLATVHFQVVSGVFDRELAICDDTRLNHDRKTASSTTCIDRPLGRFPTAAELDTFLYARGGVPIKCYPPGSVSRMGVFSGYDFDTLNMRTMKLNPTPSLAQLCRYKRLIWLVDAAAIEIGTGFGTDLDITTMRYMNSAGHQNTLAAYLRQGGEVWLAGGGSLGAAAMATNNSANDRPTRTFSAAALELVPGRFAYDFAHWRSEFKPTSGAFQIRKNLGRLADTGAYPLFPDQINPKSLALGDTMPAWRTSSGDFYMTAFNIEAITQPNRVIEDFDPDPELQDLHSTMDTIYVAQGGTLPGASPIMTVYHGADCPRVIVTGFDLWSYSRSSIKSVVDAVLQGMWGMNRRAPAMAVSSRSPR